MNEVECLSISEYLTLQNLSKFPQLTFEEIFFEPEKINRVIKGGFKQCHSNVSFGVHVLKDVAGCG